jgi:hypothetical protein
MAISHLVHFAYPINGAHNRSICNSPLTNLGTDDRNVSHSWRCIFHNRWRRPILTNSEPLNQTSSGFIYILKTSSPGSISCPHFHIQKHLLVTNLSYLGCSSRTFVFSLSNDARIHRFSAVSFQPCATDHNTTTRASHLVLLACMFVRTICEAAEMRTPLLLFLKLEDVRKACWASGNVPVVEDGDSA